MKRIIFIIAISLLSCKKEEVKPIKKDNVTTNANTPGGTIVNTYLFESNLDDSLFINSDTISTNGYLYNINQFTVRIADVTPDSVRVGNYTNEYLIRNVDNYGLKLIHTVIVGDGSKVQIELGSTATQIINLDVVKVQNDSIWINYNVNWTYKHWLHTDKNATGNIKCELNGFKYK